MPSGSDITVDPPVDSDVQWAKRTIREHAAFPEWLATSHKLNMAVRERAQRIRQLDDLMMDDITTDAFVSAHLKVRKLQRLEGRLRATIAKAVGLSATDAHTFFPKIRR